MMPSTTPPSPETLYDQVGGEAFFTALTRAFYEGVAADPVLHPMYPEEDLGPAERRLRLFLIQYWGGPTTYSQERGHPRLRMRHAPYEVTPQAKEHWLACMSAALDRVEVSPLHRETLWDYFERAALAMVNTLPRQLPLA